MSEKLYAQVSVFKSGLSLAMAMHTMESGSKHWNGSHAHTLQQAAVSRKVISDKGDVGYYLVSFLSLRPTF